jgi:hypothetical protein
MDEKDAEEISVTRFANSNLGETLTRMYIVGMDWSAPSTFQGCLGHKTGHAVSSMVEKAFCFAKWYNTEIKLTIFLTESFDVAD